MKTITYLLRNVPVSPWRKFAARCKREGQSARAVLLLLISQYANGRVRK